MSSFFPFSTPIPILLLLYIAHIHTHALQVNLNPSTNSRNLDTPITILMINRNNVPSANLTLHISPHHHSETLVSITHTVLPPSTVTFFPTVARQITLHAIVTFPAIGITNFTITAHTTNPLYIYEASFRAITAGIAIAKHRTQVLSPAGPGLSLGAYRTWVSMPQLALPIQLQPPFQGAPINLHLRLTAISGDEPTTGTPIDAVDSGTCTISLPSNVSTPPNTIFFHGRSRISTNLIAFQPGCALAISDDFKWLLVRFNPYRVAQYGFGLSVEWRAPSNLPEMTNFFPMHTFVRFLFDHVIPPVIIRSFTAVMDPFGGELLEIPVENVLSPPHISDLAPSDIMLILQVTTTSQLVTLTMPERVDRIDGALFRRVLRFRTKPLRARSQRVQYLLLGGKQKIIPAVVQPDEAVNLSLAPHDLALLDSCFQNETVYKDGFLLVEIGMPYNKSTFTQFKSNQIRNYLCSFFPWLPVNGLRLAHVDTGLIRFAVLIVKEVGNISLARQADGLDDAIKNGSFARAINVWEKDVTSHKIEKIQKTLCKAFPHLLLSSSNNLEIYGMQLWLLLLWVFLAVAASFTTTILITLSTFDTNNKESNENAAIGNLQKKNTTATNALSSLYPYPSEARQVFARRYHVDGVITTQNVRDSDLASTIVGEPEPGLGGFVNLATQLGRAFGAGLGHHWNIPHGKESQNRSRTTQTRSDSETLTIYIQHVPDTSSESAAL